MLEEVRVRERKSTKHGEVLQILKAGMLPHVEKIVGWCDFIIDGAEVVRLLKQFELKIFV